MKSYTRFIFDTPETIFFVYVPSSIKVAHGGWIVNPPKGYQIRRDSVRPPNAKRHYHIYSNGEEIGVINSDGSGSHGTYPQDMPKTIKKFLEDMGVIIPIILPELDRTVLDAIFIEKTFSFDQIVR